MDTVFNFLLNEFELYNSTRSTQQITPEFWESLEKYSIADDFTIVDEWALYKVASVYPFDCYVFARTANGMLTDFGWSYTPDSYARWFEKG